MSLMGEMMKFNFKVTKEEKGYSASCVEIKGCRTQADTKKELAYNMREVLNLCLEDESKWPKPRKSKAGWVNVSVDRKLVTKHSKK